MRCVVCKHGKTREGNTTITLERYGATLVIKNVPARICTNCGEMFVAQKISERLLRSANETLRAGVAVDIREYKAA